MGTWFQEEVAGDRYIFDSELNPVVLGCPQGEPVFVIPGEHAAEAERACVAHNAALDGTRERAAEIRSDFKRLAEKIADGTSPRVKQGEGKPYAIPSVAEYEVLMEAYLQQRHEIARVKHAAEAERACVAHNAYYDAKLDEWRRRAEAAEYRIEHPPLAENQDDLARICFEAYMQYSSPESLVDKPWSDEDPWETYAWRLAANAVRVAVEAESLRVVPVVLERGEEAKITAGTAVPHSLDEALPGDD